jgi:hypothetical protein
MKKWMIFVFATLFITGCVPTTPSSAMVDASVLSGRWVGTYTCTQGITGLELNVSGEKSGLVSAVFSFFAVTANPGVPSGSYKMRGTYDAQGTLTLTANNESDWISRPSGYGTVDLQGKIVGNNYSGNFTGGSCTTFSVSK